MSSPTGCLTVLRGGESQSPEMGVLIIAGAAAVAIGLTLLILGGAGHQPVRVSLREGSVRGQAWLMVLVLGFALIALDVYLSTLHP